MSETSEKMSSSGMEDTAVRKFSFDCRVETQYPHCVLPPNFFDRMLAKVSGKEEIRSANIIRAPKPAGH